MKKLTTFATAAALLGLTAAVSADDHAMQPDLGPAERIQAIEDAHHAAVYDKQRAIQARFALAFGPMQIDGVMFFTPSMSRAKLHINDHAIITFDGHTAWMVPADAEVPGPPPRFHVLTWPYFLAAPYKLNDPGTVLTDAGDLPVREGQILRGTKITFDDGVGDTPDDWYIAFADPDTGRLTALAYIVTYGNDQETAEDTPGIILYDDFVDVQGVPIATTWTFHHWNVTQGVHGEPKGHATLSDLRLLDNLSATTFEKPHGAVEVQAPGQ